MLYNDVSIDALYCKDGTCLCLMALYDDVEFKTGPSQPPNLILSNYPYNAFPGLTNLELLSFFHSAIFTKITILYQKYARYSFTSYLLNK